MVTKFRFPDVGEGIMEGELIRWLVREGETVKQDQSLAEVETDKAVVELPSPVSGVVLQLHAKAGERIKVGAVLVTLGEKGEKIAEKEVNAEQPKPAKKMPPAFEEKKEIKSIIKPVQTAKGSVFAMPHTRKLARMLGVNIQKLPGTGPGGRVTDADVKRFKEKKEVPGVSFVSTKHGGKTVETNEGREERMPLRGLRKTIADNVARAFRTTIPVTVMDEVNVTTLWELRKKENEKLKEHGVHLTFLPFVIKASLVALEKFPYFNASIDDEKQEIVLKHYFHIGIAVDTPAGLMVPVIKNADNKSMLEIAIEMQELAKEARERKIALQDLKGSSFSITNYGSVGGRFGTPIINYPNVAVLGLGRVYEKPVVKEEKIVIQKVFPLSLTFDHRIVDGSQASRFLEEIMKQLEDPSLLLVNSF